MWLCQSNRPGTEEPKWKAVLRHTCKIWFDFWERFWTWRFMSYDFLSFLIISYVYFCHFCCFFLRPKNPYLHGGHAAPFPSRCHELLAKRSCVKVSRCVSWLNSTVRLETIQQTFLTKISKDYWCDKSYWYIYNFHVFELLDSVLCFFCSNRFLTRWQDDFPR